MTLYSYDTQLFINIISKVGFNLSRSSEMEN